MQDLNVTLVQADQKWEDKTANYSNYERLLLNLETDLIILPEMFNTGFSMRTDILAENMKNSTGIEWLRKTASEKNSALYTSLIIEDEGNVYNRGVFVYPSGDIKYYDKRKAFGLADEDKFFKSGAKETIVDYMGWKFQLQICYDLRFPELSRNRIEPNLREAYDVLLYVANWPEKRIAHWNALLKARAIENQCYVIGVNRVGKDEKNLEYNGSSRLIDALGKTTCVEENEELVKTVQISFNKLMETRELLPFLKDR
jgi:omega-amidase